MGVTTPTQNRRCLPNLKIIKSSIPICHICSCNVVDNEAHFVLECPLYDSIRDRFLSLFENAVLGSVESFYQLDHRVDISRYFTEECALCYSTEVAF